MSFILDALRKSETERQRQSGPGLADAGYRPPVRRRGWWLPVLVVVLGANLLLMAALWLRRETPPPAVAAPPAAAVTAPPATAAPAASAVATATQPADVDAAAEAQFASVADIPAEEPIPVADAQPPPGATTESGAGSRFVEEGLPTVQQLSADGSLSLPAMHLDIHVFSTAPAERFVFINMRRYAEGTQLTEGPRVEEITPEGVVLSQNGRRFMLARD
jgi:general secretion pathway protein B